MRQGSLSLRGGPQADEAIYAILVFRIDCFARQKLRSRNDTLFMGLKNDW